MARKPTEPGNDELAVQAELEALAHAIVACEGDATDLDTAPVAMISADDLVEAEEEARA